MTLLMTHLLMLLKGFFAGFVYNFIGLAAAVFISNFVFNEGKKKAFIASIAISITNVLWAAISAFLFTFALAHLGKNIHFYTFVGSCILLYFAYQIYFKKSKKRVKFFKNYQSSERVFLEGIVFGVSSPEKILGYGALFALVSTKASSVFALEKIPLVLGVGIGSLGWWALYIYILHGASSTLSSERTHLFQKGSAYFLAGLALIGFGSSFVQWIGKI